MYNESQVSVITEAKATSSFDLETWSQIISFSDSEGATLNKLQTKLFVT